MAYKADGGTGLESQALQLRCKLPMFETRHHMLQSKVTEEQSTVNMPAHYAAMIKATCIASLTCVASGMNLKARPSAPCSEAPLLKLYT
jgi:hypothetical protein